MRAGRRGQRPASSCRPRGIVVRLHHDVLRFQRGADGGGFHRSALSVRRVADGGADAWRGRHAGYDCVCVVAENGWREFGGGSRSRAGGEWSVSCGGKSVGEGGMGFQRVVSCRPIAIGRKITVPSSLLEVLRSSDGRSFGRASANTVDTSAEPYRAYADFRVIGFEEAASESDRAGGCLYCQQSRLRCAPH